MTQLFVFVEIKHASYNSSNNCRPCLFLLQHYTKSQTIRTRTLTHTHTHTDRHTFIELRLWIHYKKRKSSRWKKYFYRCVTYPTFNDNWFSMLTKASSWSELNFHGSGINVPPHSPRDRSLTSKQNSRPACIIDKKHYLHSFHIC